MNRRLLAMALQEIECCLPGLYNVEGVSGLDGDSMDVVCIIVIQDKYVLFS